VPLQDLREPDASHDQKNDEGQGGEVEQAPPLLVVAVLPGTGTFTWWFLPALIVVLTMHVGEPYYGVPGPILLDLAE